MHVRQILGLILLIETNNVRALFSKGKTHNSILIPPSYACYKSGLYVVFVSVAAGIDITEFVINLNKILL